MSRPLWNYPTVTLSEPILTSVFQQHRCPCCRTVRMESSEGNDKGDGRFHTEFDCVLVCPNCGWWFAYHYRCRNDDCRSLEPEVADLHIAGSGAALERYDGFGDGSALLMLQQEVEKHLLRHGSSDSWATMEDATAAILRSFGYQVRVTARSKDGGVDIILENGSLGSVFIQVKHSRNRIDVEVFRELVGTMCIEGVPSGMLVTSSRFTGPTKQLADKAQARGITVELVDGERFLAALNLCARLKPPTLEEIFAVARSCTTIKNERITI